MNKIKKGDNVIVIAGKDKSKVGTVLRVIGTKVWVEGVNLIKKHVKPNPQKNQQGGIVEYEAGLNVSNLALLDPTTKGPARVGFKYIDKKKVRYFKKSGELVDMV